MQSGFLLLFCILCATQALPLSLSGSRQGDQSSATLTRDKRGDDDVADSEVRTIISAIVDAILDGDKRKRSDIPEESKQEIKLDEEQEKASKRGLKPDNPSSTLRGLLKSEETLLDDQPKDSKDDTTSDEDESGTGSASGSGSGSELLPSEESGHVREESGDGNERRSIISKERAILLREEKDAESGEPGSASGSGSGGDSNNLEGSGSGSGNEYTKRNVVPRDDESEESGSSESGNSFTGSGSGASDQPEPEAESGTGPVASFEKTSSLSVDKLRSVFSIENGVKEKDFPDKQKRDSLVDGVVKSKDSGAAQKRASEVDKRKRDSLVDGVVKSKDSGAARKRASESDILLVNRVPAVEKAPLIRPSNRSLLTGEESEVSKQTVVALPEIGSDGMESGDSGDSGSGSGKYEVSGESGSSGVGSASAESGASSDSGQGSASGASGEGQMKRSNIPTEDEMGESGSGASIALSDDVTRAKSSQPTMMSSGSGSASGSGSGSGDADSSSESEDRGEQSQKRSAVLKEKETPSLKVVASSTLRSNKKEEDSESGSASGSGSGSSKDDDEEYDTKVTKRNDVPHEMETKETPALAGSEDSGSESGSGSASASGSGSGSGSGEAQAAEILTKRNSIPSAPKSQADDGSAESAESGESGSGAANKVTSYKKSIDLKIDTSVAASSSGASGNNIDDTSEPTKISSNQNGLAKNELSLHPQSKVKGQAQTYKGESDNNETEKTGEDIDVEKNEATSGKVQKSVPSSNSIEVSTYKAANKVTEGSSSGNGDIIKGESLSGEAERDESGKSEAARTESGEAPPAANVGEFKKPLYTPVSQNAASTVQETSSSGPTIPPVTEASLSEESGSGSTSGSASGDILSDKEKRSRIVEEIIHDMAKAALDANKSGTGNVVKKSSIEKTIGEEAKEKEGKEEKEKVMTVKRDLDGNALKELVQKLLSPVEIQITDEEEENLRRKRDLEANKLQNDIYTLIGDRVKKDVASDDISVRTKIKREIQNLEGLAGSLSQTRGLDPIKHDVIAQKLESDLLRHLNVPRSLESNLRTEEEKLVKDTEQYQVQKRFAEVSRHTKEYMDSHENELEQVRQRAIASVTPIIESLPLKRNDISRLADSVGHSAWLRMLTSTQRNESTTVKVRRNLEQLRRLN